MTSAKVASSLMNAVVGDRICRRVRLRLGVKARLTDVPGREVSPAMQALEQICGGLTVAVEPVHPWRRRRRRCPGGRTGVDTVQAKTRGLSAVDRPAIAILPKLTADAAFVLNAHRRAGGQGIRVVSKHRLGHEPIMPTSSAAPTAAASSRIPSGSVGERSI